MTVILVGELNPYGSDPKYALYPQPPNSAGGRLCEKILGMRRRDYVALDRVNLCTGHWSMPAARAHATKLREGRAEDPIFVLLGRKVATAFGLPGEDFFTCGWWGSLFEREARWLLLPHPSGRCLVWNDRTAITRTRVALRILAPDLPLGADS
jgi:hypothetical protein